jgi:uncharacterized protein (TIGR02284 family)
MLLKAFFMKKNEKTIEVLNDLIRINKDRIAGYEKAGQENTGVDADIRNFFYTMSIESRSFVNDLHAEVLRLGGVPVSGSTISGKIYLFWLDMQSEFLGGLTGNDTYSLLTAGEAGEEAVQKVYGHALNSEVELPENIERLIERQSFRLKRSKALMKKYKDERMVTK